MLLGWWKINLYSVSPSFQPQGSVQFKLSGITKALVEGDVGFWPWLIFWQKSLLPCMVWSVFPSPADSTAHGHTLDIEIFLRWYGCCLPFLLWSLTCPKDYKKTKLQGHDLDCYNILSLSSSLGEIFFCLGWGWGEVIKNLILMLLFQDSFFFPTKESLCLFVCFVIIVVVVVLLPPQISQVRRN